MGLHWQLLLACWQLQQPLALLWQLLAGSLRLWRPGLRLLVC